MEVASRSPRLGNDIYTFLLENSMFLPHNIRVMRGNVREEAEGEEWKGTGEKRRE